MLKLTKKLVISLFFIPSFSCAAGDSLFLSGAGATPITSYYYLGYLAPLGSSKLGNGYVQRFWLDYLTYEYESNLSTIKAKAPGISYSIGYQASDEISSAGVFLGVDNRKTTLSPDDLGNSSRGHQLSSLVALEGSLTKHSLIASVNANYLNETKAYWSRVRFLVDGPLKWGPELSWQGDPTYHEKKIGFYFGDLKVNDDLKIGANLGRSYTQTRNDFYFGLELTKLLK